MANPLIRPYLHFLPEARPNHLSEARHAKRWLEEVDDSHLTPMVRSATAKQDFFIHEPTMLQTNEVCLPLRFFTSGGIVFAKTYRMLKADQHGEKGWIVDMSSHLSVPISQFAIALPRLLSSHERLGIPDPTKIFGWSSSRSPSETDRYLRCSPSE